MIQKRFKKIIYTSLCYATDRERNTVDSVHPRCRHLTQMVASVQNHRPAFCTVKIDHTVDITKKNVTLIGPLRLLLYNCKLYCGIFLISKTGMIATCVMHYKKQGIVGWLNHRGGGS